MRDTKRETRDQLKALELLGRSEADFAENLSHRFPEGCGVSTRNSTTWWRIDRSFDWGSARPYSVGWTRADKRPGSRISGWELMRERLKNSMAKDGPGLYVFNTCRQFIRTVPVLPRDEAKPDDIDKEAENHVADETRYRILANGNFFTEGHLT